MKKEKSQRKSSRGKAGEASEKQEWTVDTDDSGLPPTDSSKDWEFDRSKLTQEAKLGSGQFGIVFEGLAIGILPGEAQTRVAVKMLSAQTYVIVLLVCT